ncbi:uncharacterized protein (DUF2147 family) [Limimaricola soesokkakensis]|uniref:Uncharacterized protein (DUF2147 family) n=1 Tax=Limimaricola soesokkakensis TaxID=1343159 RepID=A0A1X6Y8H1_9RHOB|nr:DUF2147 domain-containing protein [Limimaricola soesokkakensis]PSK87233.1 uncharacterized protein (DUF2147 family) [Limimaricola soesokkakensis]SLN13857.1 hypothetical protein LOS8367_00115 [Limimaricola soesokkakensis]
MKRLAWAACAFVALAGAASAEPLLGTWRTAPDDNGNSGLVQVAPCGAQLCGQLVKAFGPGGSEIASPNLGRNIISATEPVGGGEYRGKVFAPDSGKTYNSKLVLAGDRLSVSGCVLGFCREGGVWQKLP